VIRLLLLVTMLAGSNESSSAHAVVVETIPADEAVLLRAPDSVVIRFNEPVTPLFGQVLDARGRDVTPAGALSARDRDVRIALPPDLAEGSYVASFRVVSIDSHPIGGSIVFTIGTTADPISAQRMAADSPGWRVALIVDQLILYAGLLGSVGAVLFVYLVRPSEGTATLVARSAARIAAVAVFAALLAIGIEGALLAAGGPGALANLATWRIGLGSSFGQSAATALVGLALISAGFCSGSSRIGRVLAATGAAIALASFALSGHVVTAGPYWLTAPVLVVHAAAAAFWAGALLPLWRAIRLLGADAVPLVRRFSRLAIAIVPVLLAAGLVIATLQVETPGALIDTEYGRILLLKLVAVTGLLAVAALNKLRLTPALARGEARAAVTLRRAIGVEAALVAAILLATIMLGTTPPPRVLSGGEGLTGLHHQHGHDAPKFSTMAQSGTIRAEIEVSPAQSGRNTILIRLVDAAGAPLEPREAIVALANLPAGVEPIRRAANRTGPGTYRLDDVVLVPAGTWSIRIEALVGDFDERVFETELEIR
jgi:copper transport protein